MTSDLNDTSLFIRVPKDRVHETTNGSYLIDTG